MANASDISLIWKESGYNPPNKIFAVVENPEGVQTLIVVSDNKNIITLLNAQGDVFYVSKTRCNISGENYICRGPLYSTGCMLDDERVDFARRDILPYFYIFDVPY